MDAQSPIAGPGPGVPPPAGYTPPQGFPPPGAAPPRRTGLIAAIVLGGGCVCAILALVGGLLLVAVAQRPGGLPILRGSTTAAATVTALSRIATQVYGPVDGSLDHHGDNKLPYKSSYVSLRDVMVAAEFDNPYKPNNTYGWDYGFIFRETDEREYRLYVTSDSEWSFKLVDLTGSQAPAGPVLVAQPAPTWTPLGSGALKTLGGGALSNFALAVGASNRLRLLAAGSRGYFYVNDQYIASLDLSRLTVVGDVRVGTAFRVDDNNPGQSTVYRNFSVWSLER
jgi:hypothetical protein